MDFYWWWWWEGTWGIMEEVLGTGAPSWGAATAGRGSPPGVQEKVFFNEFFASLNVSEIQVL